MNTIWQVTLDRYGDESKAKGNHSYSIIETCDLLINKYERCTYKARLSIEIIGAGIGMAAYTYLRHKKIPCKLIKGVVTRIGSADLHLSKGD